MAIKETKRKAFNFFRSYYDVFNELSNDKDKLAFIEALLDRQFLGVKPNDLKGMAKFAWISQVNSIDTQVKGYEDKTKTKLYPTDGGAQRGKLPPTVQEEGQEEEKEEVEYTKAFSSENDFIEKFNVAKKHLTGVVGRTKILSKTDKNNFKALNTAYELKDFRHALTMMGASKWVKDNKMFTTAHFLVNDNFNKYLNQVDSKPMAQGLIEGN